MLWALAGIAVGVITELTGIKKYKPYPDPKTITETIKEWPLFVVVSVTFFVVTFLWQYFKTEKINKICPNCGDVVSTGVDENPQCRKCNIPLENLEGFFERHPEKR